jgi:transposase
LNITCGIDWAEAHHDVALVDVDGTTVAKLRIDTGLPGFTALMTLIAEHSDEPKSVAVAIKTDKNLIVAALQAAGLTVHAINPRAVARYRERSAQAGGKSDPGDAIVLANILRTDLHLHRTLPRISEGGLAVKALARQHQEAIWARQLTVNRLRSVLMEFYPNAIRAFPVLTHKAALEIIGTAPSPTHGVKLTHKRVVSLLQRSGRGDRPGLAEAILKHLHEPALRQPPAVEAALSHAVIGLVRVIKTMEASIDALEVAMADEFEQHHAAELLRSAPGLGAILAARVLGEVGDDTARFSTAGGLRAFAGTAPITRASGRSKVVRTRYVKNKRLADACHWWAFAAISRSPGARAHYDARRAAGDRHNAALRNLANKLLGRLWWCLVNDLEWDDDAAWPASAKTGEEAAA